jgi:hypothetical protein
LFLKSSFCSFGKLVLTKIYGPILEILLYDRSNSISYFSWITLRHEEILLWEAFKDIREGIYDVEKICSEVILFL